MVSRTSTREPTRHLLTVARHTQSSRTSQVNLPVRNFNGRWTYVGRTDPLFCSPPSKVARLWVSRRFLRNDRATKHQRRSDRIHRIAVKEENRFTMTSTGNSTGLVSRRATQSGEQWPKRGDGLPVSPVSSPSTSTCIIIIFIIFIVSYTSYLHAPLFTLYLLIIVTHTHTPLVPPRNSRERRRRPKRQCDGSSRSR
jgi:hypothetical protein